MKNILVFSPHNDDLEIAMGGTALKYIKEGYNIIKIIFSVGELSNPHLKESYITKEREKQALEAEKKFGFHKTIFLKLTDAKLKHEIELVREDIEDLIKEYNPEKIFIPSFKDIHPNHRAVTKLMKDIMKNKNIATYGYEVWSLTDENLPKIYVDITPYFKKKIAMIKIFNPTEWLSVYLQYIPIYIRAIRFGRKIKVKYAERFYRIR
ncbi:PIG-L family deacetylase [Candidatus Woesearchaeota archaeon]|nr:PIG-L family deacetylase [Candidatus Woesearchaeota archaeon]